MAYDRENYLKNREIRLQKQKEYYRANKEARNAYNRQYARQNREAIFAQKRARREENPEVGKERNRDWYLKNQEYAKARSKEYRLANKESDNAWRKEYHKKREQSEPMYLLKRRMRTLIYAKFRQGGYTKKSKASEILGCSFEELKFYLELQFKPGMTWLNHGEWHIDHIIPLATAESEVDVIRLNHYTNLQPLWATENLLKGAKHA